MRIVSGRHRIAENYFQTKHVVAAGGSAWDAGSTPAASTIFYWGIAFIVKETGQQDLENRPVQAFLSRRRGAGRVLHIPVQPRPVKGHHNHVSAMAIVAPVLLFRNINDGESEIAQSMFILTRWRIG